MKIVTLLFILFLGITGNTVSDDPFSGGVPDSEIECMENCIGEYCTIGDVECAEPYTDGCMDECGAVMPEQTEDEQCVQECLYSNCGEFDWDCQDSVIAECDVECGMLGDAPDWDGLSEEEQCITLCVADIDPTLICGASSEGETGNEICQQCAEDCVYLYEGPCLMDEELTVKENDCVTCEHCYGSPVMGDSGEGYECIVDIECLDASDEFGDDAGSGPGIGQEGYVPVEEESPSTFISGVVDFFKGIFK
ncbi:hypothetical protein HOD38_00025 [archaeon]|jgi:hypothetical protein|nr:hypothetical protein [archaeon]MBT4396634.1 hypothetical protein [archaeon]MBT4441244.1 hypothetical protein [archaeon]